ncbi:MAG: PAS domain S-box protein [Desulfobacteraceae bacterium]|nr:MAG: PAS domain S-box protein [Desulfobacteraceae bacterium]
MKLFPKPIKLSLRAKIALLIESLVVIFVVVTGVITTMREKETLVSELRKRGLALADDLAKFTVRPLLSQDLTTLRRFVNHSMTQDYVRYVFILDPHGKVVMHSNLAEVGKTYKDSVNIAAVNSKGPGCILLSERGKLYFDMFTPIRVSNVRLGTVRLGYSHIAIEKEIANARQQIFLIGLVTAIIGGVIAYFLATFISLPIKEITDATEKVANGDLNTRLTIKRNDEIGALANSFNKMTEDLRRTTISKDYVDNIIGSMNDTLVVVDPNAKISSVNKATCDLLGYKENELIGKDINRIVPLEEKIFRDSGFQRLLGGETLVNHEIDYMTRNGKRVPMLFSAAVLINKEGKTEGVVGIARDITERREAEEALRQSERELHFLSYQLLSAQEKERRRLSVELHDELGQALMVFKLKVRSIQRALGKGQANLKAECDEVIAYINEVTENVRRLSRDLSPSILEDLGLSAAIRWLVEASTKHYNIKSSLDMNEMDYLFSHEGQITVYRIVQECLTNIAKHAQATQVSIAISKQDDEVLFSVEDDGKGFDVKEAFSRDPIKKGLGLSAMYERVRILGGSLDIWSEKGTGTRITFKVPLDERGNRW